MGLFTPKISRAQIDYVKILLKQANESANLINKTVKPDVFFGRLGFLLDVLLELQKYEKYKIFTNSSPSRDYQKLIGTMEKTVDDFIDRAVSANQEKMKSLKTQSAKDKNAEKFAQSMQNSFSSAKTFWQGNKMYPHYTGSLYTEKNLERVKKL